MSELQSNNSIPNIPTKLSSEQLNTQLLKLSKKGKLPGFESLDKQGVIKLAAHGIPFDSKLHLTVASDQIESQVKLNTLFPTIFGVLLIITIWPGLPLTDGFLSSFEWYEKLMSQFGLKTWYWYLPLTVIPTPFAWKSALRKSKLSAYRSAKEAIEKVQSVNQI